LRNFRILALKTSSFMIGLLLGATIHADPPLNRCVATFFSKTLFSAACEGGKAQRAAVLTNDRRWH
jgi:hypothetical protein